MTILKFKQFVNESLNEAKTALVKIMKGDSEISPSDIKAIEKLPPNGKVTLTGDGVKDFATGMQGDLHPSKNNTYTKDEVLNWLAGISNEKVNEYGGESDWTYGDSVETAGGQRSKEMKNISSFLQQLGVKDLHDLALIASYPDENFNDRMWKPGIGGGAKTNRSEVYDTVEIGTYDGKPAIVGNSAGDLFAFVKESLNEGVAPKGVKAIKAAQRLYILVKKALGPQAKPPAIINIPQHGEEIITDYKGKQIAYSDPEQDSGEYVYDFDADYTQPVDYEGDDAAFIKAVKNSF